MSKFAQNPPSNGGHRINKAIRAAEVRVINEDGEMLGVMSVEEGLRMAQDAGLDLVEVGATSNPPVCKILDYGKLKYIEQKKRNEAKKKQKIVSVKEVKMRPVTGEGDYQVKMKNLRRFLADGDKVKITIRFRGREMDHQELGLRILKRIEEEVQEIAKIDLAPKVEGRQMMMIISPATQTSK